MRRHAPLKDWIIQAKNNDKENISMYVRRLPLAQSKFLAPNMVALRGLSLAFRVCLRSKWNFYRSKCGDVWAFSVPVFISRPLLLVHFASELLSSGDCSETRADRQRDSHYQTAIIYFPRRCFSFFFCLQMERGERGACWNYLRFQAIFCSRNMLGAGMHAAVSLHLFCRGRAIGNCCSFLSIGKKS